MRVGDQQPKLSHEDKGWCHVHTKQNRHQKGVAVGFAMRAGNRKRLISSGQIWQKFIALNRRDSLFASGKDFGVIVTHG